LDLATDLAGVEEPEEFEELELSEVELELEGEGAKAGFGK